MQELWDIYDVNGVLTGEVLERTNEILPAGKYHVVVHIWLYNDRGQILIQQRAAHVYWAPGKWATTGGSVISGEKSLAGAIREVEEELGLRVQQSDMHFVARVIRKSAFTDIWMAKTDADINSCKLEDAVAAVRYVTPVELQTMIADGSFVDYTGGEAYTEEIMDEIFAKADMK
jgi:8-oxo-dGTP diphosphatase